MMSGTSAGILGRLAKILDRTRPFPALLEMHSQFRSNFRSANTVNGYSCLGDTTVDLRPPHRRHQTVRHLDIEHMVESVARRDSAIRKFDQPRRRQELVTTRKLFAMFLDPLNRHVESCCNCYRRALHAHDTCSFEHTSLIRAETFNLLFDQLLD